MNPYFNVPQNNNNQNAFALNSCYNMNPNMFKNFNNPNMGNMPNNMVNPNNTIINPYAMNNQNNNFMNMNMNNQMNLQNNPAFMNQANFNNQNFMMNQMFQNNPNMNMNNPNMNMNNPNINMNNNNAFPLRSFSGNPNQMNNMQNNMNLNMNMNMNLNMNNNMNNMKQQPNMNQNKVNPPSPKRTKPSNAQENIQAPNPVNINASEETPGRGPDPESRSTDLPLYPFAMDSNQKADKNDQNELFPEVPNSQPVSDPNPEPEPNQNQNENQLALDTFADPQPKEESSPNEIIYTTAINESSSIGAQAQNEFKNKNYKKSFSLLYNSKSKLEALKASVMSSKITLPESSLEELNKRIKNINAFYNSKFNFYKINYFSISKFSAEKEKSTKENKPLSLTLENIYNDKPNIDYTDIYDESSNLLKGIYNCYQKSLQIANLKILLLYGQPGSGKTQIVKAFANLINARVIQIDKIEIFNQVQYFSRDLPALINKSTQPVVVFFKSFENYFSQKQNEMIYILDKILESKKNFVICSTNYPPKFVPKNLTSKISYFHYVPNAYKKIDFIKFMCEKIFIYFKCDDEDKEEAKEVEKNLFLYSNKEIFLIISLIRKNKGTLESICCKDILDCLEKVKPGMTMDKYKSYESTKYSNILK